MESSRTQQIAGWAPALSGEQKQGATVGRTEGRGAPKPPQIPVIRFYSILCSFLLPGCQPAPFSDAGFLNEEQ